MKIIILSLLTLSCALFASEPSGALQQDAAPAAGKVAGELLWIADTHKMDRFLARFTANDLHPDAYAGEVLPDTRAAWRDYALQAVSLAKRGREAQAAAKLSQMLKLAALYRSFGGLQNVVQSEEIRYSAGLTAEMLGNNVTALIRSPYLEKDADECVSHMESQIGAQKDEVTPAFLLHLKTVAIESHTRLTPSDVTTIAARP